MEGRLSETYPPLSAAHHGLANCKVCHKLSSACEKHCTRCRERLHIRIPRSTQQALAFVITSVLFYIPANLFPIMSTEVLGNQSPSTIIGGIIIFLEHGSYFIAAVIFLASVIVPIAKMAAISWLCYSTNRLGKLNQYELTRLYRMTEFVGKWSMIDVYVVAILVALIQITGLMSIQPGTAANAFAAMVILTMIAAQKFDVRLIWDKLEHR